MIHTIELTHQIPYEHVQAVLQCIAMKDEEMNPERDCQRLTNRLQRGANAAKGEIDAFLQDVGYWVNLADYDRTTKFSRNAKNLGNGINGFMVIRNCTVQQKNEEETEGVLECNFYIIIRLNLRTMMNHRDVYTIRLYQALPENNELVERNFYQRMQELLSPAVNLDYLYDFRSWNCHRIDYTCNMKFKTHEQFELFMKLTRKTSSYNRTEIIKDNDIRPDEQSTAEGNKSYKSMFYDKHEECKANYKNISAEAYRRLLGEAQNVARFEVQCKSGKLKSMVKKYGFPDRLAWRFLREDISMQVLLDRYDKAVGNGDFYERWRAKSIIQRNIKSPAMQAKLIQFTQLLAEKRHLTKAREFFTSATSDKSKFPLAHGTASTFLARKRKLIEIGINPMLITDKCPIKHLRNPRHFITGED